MFEAGDGLGLGCGGSFPRESGVCDYVVNLMPYSPKKRGKQQREKKDEDEDEDEVAFVVLDLANDERFADCPLVTGPPYARFYAGVPILSPRGIAIGSYAVMDEKPRDKGLDASQLRFMRDVAATVMNHLAMSRWKDRHRRGERMIAGLGSFLENKGTIRGTVQEVEKEREKEIEDELPFQNVLQEPHALEGRLNVQQQGIQDRVDDLRGGSDVHHDTLRQPKPASALHQRETSVEEKLAKNIEQKVSTSPFHLKTTQIPEEDTPKEDMSGASGTHQTFSRAANVIRESIEVEGVVFFDASVQSYTGIQTASNENTSDSENTIYSSSETPHASEDDKSADDAKNKNPSDADPLLSDVLGFSTSAKSSINDDSTRDDRRLRISEPFLQVFLRRYPFGKIFNFNENGAMSSGDSSDDRSTRSSDNSFHAARTRRKRTTTRAKLTKEDADRLIQIFPGARSIAFFPLWDSHRVRWFSGCFTWTNTPMRVFTATDELSYMYAFGNSIMAEIARQDVETADRAKVNLVSSISHELRSPLHGIAGTLELLADSGLNALQREMASMIGSCSRTLLDIVEHLLDFTEINNAAASGAELARPGWKRNSAPALARSSGSSRLSDAGRNKLSQVGSRKTSRTLSNVRLDVVFEEVVDAVCAGQNFRILHNIHGTDSTISPSAALPAPTTVASGPMVVLDIQAAPSWTFDTEPGAWRRILMNLFGNALKYTQSGVITVKLTSTPAPAVKKRPNASRSQTPASNSRRRPALKRHGSSFRAAEPEPELELRPSKINDTGLKKPRSNAQSPSNSRSKSRIVTLTVSDTGRGIQREYLRDHLFTPFSQEDPLVPGNGLGLSIVRQAVRLLGGKIGVDSTVGTGTVVTVEVKIHEVREAGDEAGTGSEESQCAGSDTTVPAQDGKGKEKYDSDLIIERVRQRVSGKTVGLVGFGNGDDRTILRGSLEQVCKDWFGMDTFVIPASIDTDHPEPNPRTCFDFYITTVDGMRELDDDVKDECYQRPPVITICDTFDSVQAMVQAKSVANAMSKTMGTTEFISQPCGPRKLAKSFDICLDRPSESSVGVGESSSSPMGQGQGQHRFPFPFPSPATSTSTSTSRRTLLESSRSESYNSSTQTDMTTPPSLSLSLSLPLPFPLMSPLARTSPADMIGQYSMAQLEGKEHEHGLTLSSTAEAPEPEPELETQHERQSPLETVQETVTEAAPSSPPVRPSALLVDDNAINLRLLEAIVKKHHPAYTYATATNGIEAVDTFIAAATGSGGGFQAVLMGE